MKSVKWMLAALLAVTVCTPLMAQNNKDLGAKLQRQIQVQQKKHHQAAKCRWCGNQITDLSRRCPADPDVYCTPEPNPGNETCYRCGQKFTRGQKCPETQYYRFCAANYHQVDAIQREQNFVSKEDRAAKKAAKKAQKQQQTRDESRYCPKCGEEYDVDELYHNIAHRCAAEANAPKQEVEVSTTKGATLNHSNFRYQHEHEFIEVPELPYSQGLDDDIAVKAETLLQKDCDDHNGRAEHSFEYYYQQVANQFKANAKVEKCRWCGKDITNASVRCSEDPDVVCTPAPKAGSTVGVQPNTGKVSVQEETHCPKCGEEYDIDVRYHGMQHRCNTPEKPVKYHPAEK
ncbi:hypothetical protein [Candidatus Avelusimicrobium stercoris]|uniref:hypothetical protein n=1 Tax=Candidatus Avelusimicrobium stercoris TaxID=1947924 RepID=UPI003D12F885